MPFVDLVEAEWLSRFSRALLVGAPGSWKTSSLITWSGGPRVVVSYPGEHGSASLLSRPGDIIKVWRTPGKESATSVYAQVYQLTLDAVSGKLGDPGTLTFQGDGLHKLYHLIREAQLERLREINDRAQYPQTEDKLGGRAYGEAHTEFKRYLDLVNQAEFPRVVFTCWEATEKVDPTDPRSAKQIWPELPGTMQKLVMGEFGAVLRATPGVETAPGKYGLGKWQTRSDAMVQGIGVKLPVALAPKIPLYVPQDWGKLEALVRGLAQEKAA